MLFSLFLLSFANASFLTIVLSCAYNAYYSFVKCTTEYVTRRERRIGREVHLALCYQGIFYDNIIIISYIHKNHYTRREYMHIRINIYMNYKYATLESHFIRSESFVRSVIRTNCYNYLKWRSVSIHMNNIIV